MARAGVLYSGEGLAGRIGRRDLLGLLGGVAAAWPLFDQRVRGTAHPLLERVLRFFARSLPSKDRRDAARRVHDVT